MALPVRRFAGEPEAPYEAEADKPVPKGGRIYDVSVLINV
ncbi:MAG: hypothetical protein A4E55_02370 [Pelotomaculum sp. PtaU1.Bin035]|nr:MAG: hypothetical protein A4E55_02370 [Pelotomaculum sp. PtaU1.Bin035]